MNELDNLRKQILALNERVDKLGGVNEAKDRRMRDLLMNLDEDNIPTFSKYSKLISDNGNSIAELEQSVTDMGASLTSTLTYMMSGGYVIAAYSPTNGLTDTSGMRDGVYYYPTVTHSESGTTFSNAHVYKWSESAWTEDGDVTVSSTVPTEPADNAYWFCTADIDGELDYYNRFLYQYDGAHWLYRGAEGSDTSYMYSQIYQNVSANKAEIGLVVGNGKLIDGNGNISAGVIVSTINNGSATISGSRVNISASDLYIDASDVHINGSTTFASMLDDNGSTTTINGGKITANTITVREINFDAGDIGGATTGQITSAINGLFLSANGSTISLTSGDGTPLGTASVTVDTTDFTVNADNVYLNGITTLTSLLSDDYTEIDGGKITTNSITVSKLSRGRESYHNSECIKFDCGIDLSDAGAYPYVYGVGRTIYESPSYADTATIGYGLASYIYNNNRAFAIVSSTRMEIAAADELRLYCVGQEYPYIRIISGHIYIGYEVNGGYKEADLAAIIENIYQ